MDSLPEEIFSTIISLVCDGLDPGEDTYGLPHLATVSRRWQCTIENRTFRELTLNSRQLPELSKRFSGPFLKHRAVLVRSIEYHIELPCCSDEKVHQRATEQDVQETNVAISKAVRDLFDFLLLLDQARPNGPSLALGIMSVKAPTDGSLQGQDEDRFIDCEHRPVPQMSYYTYWSLRWRYKILSLLEIDELPEISCVTLFEVYDLSFSRHAQPGNWVRTASKFPCLETLTFEFREFRAWGKEVRRTLRRDFADALLELISRCSPSLNKVTLRRQFSDIKDESSNQIDYTDGNSEEGDVLSKSLFQLAQRCTALTSLRLRGFNIAPELFWPFSSNSNSPASIWPSLEDIDIEFHPVASNGEWYFTNANGTEAPPPPPDITEFDDDAIRRRENKREPTPYELGPPRPPSEAESFAEYGDEISLGEQHKYRTRPLGRTIDPLLIAAAKAVRHMPSVQCFNLHTKEQLKPKRIVSWRQGEERIFSADFWAHGSDEGNKRAELACDRTPPESWSPSSDVREEWAKTVGPNGEVYFMYGDYHGLGKWEWETLSAEELGN